MSRFKLETAERWPVTGAKTTHHTQVRILYDDRAVYVGIEAGDPDPSQIQAPLVRHDNVEKSQDFVGIYFDTEGTRQAAQFFRVNAAGSTGDGVYTAADDNEDMTPDFDFDAYTVRTAEGYNALFRIPFSTLRYSSGSGARWRFFVTRRLPREQYHLYTSNLVPTDAVSYIATMQPLVGMTIPETAGTVVVRPSLTYRNSEIRAGADSTRDSQAQASLDVKWRPVDSLVIDGTINPDFSQVELDVPQLSHNRQFALQFAEKRPFFLESVEYLRSPTAAIYTRTFTQPKAGLRATYRGDAAAGTVYGIRDEGGGHVLIPGAYGNDVALQPAFDSLQGRVEARAGDMKFAGLASLRSYHDGIGSNDVFGADTLLPFTTTTFVRAQLLHSTTDAWKGADGELTRQGAVEGNLADIELKRQSDSTSTDLSYESISRGFRNDGGFVSQSDVNIASLSHLQIWRDSASFFYERQIGLGANDTRARDTGQTVSRDICPKMNLLGPRDFDWTLELHGDSVVRGSEQSPAMHQRFIRNYINVAPSTEVPAFDIDISAGRLADYSANVTRPGFSASVSSDIRLGSRLELEPTLSASRLNGEGRAVMTEYVGNLMVIYNFDARNSLRTILQGSDFHGSEPGSLSSRSWSGVASLTYGWRKSAGTVVYVGATRSRNGGSTQQSQTEAFLKVQFDLDEVRRAWGEGSNRMAQ